MAVSILSNAEASSSFFLCLKLLIFTCKLTLKQQQVLWARRMLVYTLLKQNKASNSNWCLIEHKSSSNQIKRKYETNKSKFTQMLISGDGNFHRMKKIEQAKRRERYKTYEEVISTDSRITAVGFCHLNSSKSCFYIVSY